MRKNKLTYALIITVIVLMLIPFNSFAIEVSSYIGNIKIIRQGRTLKPKTGMKIKTGDIIRTGKLAMVVIQYNDKSKITVGAESTVIIGHKTIKNSDNISLVYGNLKGKFAKLKKGKRKVYTPTIVCAIRGTEFNIGVSKNGASRLDLNEGRVRISNPYGKTNMRQGQKIKTQVSDRPKRTFERSKIEKWQERSDKNFEKNPQKAGKRYNKYMNDFEQRGEKNEKNISKYDTIVKNTKSKRRIKHAGRGIDREAENIEDDIFLNQASYQSITDVMDDYRTRNEKIYDMFVKLKEQSNKVSEVQEQNYKQIQAVKAAHKEAYDKIMGKFQSDKEKILKGVDMESVKPKIKK